MTYSPEELLQYAKDQNMLLDLMTAAHNNDIGFKHLITTAAISRDPDGTPVLHCDLASDDDEPTDISLEDASDLNEIIREASHKKNTLMCAIVCTEAMSADGDFALFIEVGDDKSEVESTLTDRVLIDFMETAGINTRGRLKAAIRRGQEILNAYMQTPGNDDLGLLSDQTIARQRQIDRILERNSQHPDVRKG